MHIFLEFRRSLEFVFLHPNTIFVIDLIIILPETVEWRVKIEEYVRNSDDGSEDTLNPYDCQTLIHSPLRLKRLME